MKKVNLFIFCFITLSLIGIVMIYSSSSIWAEYKTGSKYFYLIRQSLFFIVAIIVYFIVSRIDFNLLKKYSNHLFIISFILLIVVLIPGIGVKRGGARSWIGINEFSIQPSELMKLAFIIFTAKFLSNYPGILKKTKYLIYYLIIVMLVFGLIMLEPDFGTGAIIVCTILLMMYVGLVKNKYLIFAGIFGLIGVVVLIASAGYRMARIQSYIDPWSDPLGSGFQIIQSLYAISPSGLFGYGLFNSRQKYFYLPEPQTDFIFAIVLEELGIIGGIFILLLFLTIIIIGFRLSLCCKDLFAMYLSLGITSLFFIQVFINISVVIGLIPVTGVTLPFLSYGGSSLVITFIMMGILVNIMRSDNVEYHFDWWKNWRAYNPFAKIKARIFKKKSTK